MNTTPSHNSPELIDLLNDLSKVIGLENAEKECWYNKLLRFFDNQNEEIVSYSTIFSYLSDMDLDLRDNLISNLHNLYLGAGDYFEKLIEKRTPGVALDYERSHFEAVRKEIFNLWDHCQMTVMSLKATEFTEKFREQAIEVESEMEALSSRLETVSKDVHEVRRSLNSSQREYVAVLGIFASVVLVFMGGIGFSTSVLSAMKKVSIFRLLLIVDGLAAVLLNAICMLMSFVFQIVNFEKPEFLKAQKTMNIVFVIIAAIIIVAWAFHLDGLRDLIGTIGSTLFS